MFDIIMTMLFQLELNLNMLDLLDQSADSVRWTPLQKQKGSPGVRPLPLRRLSRFFLGEENINCLGNEVLCVSLRTFHLWGGLVFIIDDQDNFPNWIMILNSMFSSLMMILNSMFFSWMMSPNSMFHCWRMIQYFSHCVRDFLSLS